MKKYRLVLLCFLIVVAIGLFSVPQANAAYEYGLELEWGSDEGDNASTGLRDEHPSDENYVSAEGTTFTTSDAFTIGYYQTRLNKVGHPTANLTAVVYKISGTLPYGAFLYSDPVNSSTIDTNAEWVTFNFSSSLQVLNATTTYGVVVQVNTSNVDVTNYVGFFFTSNTSANHKRIRFFNGGWLNPSDAYDNMFRIYKVTGLSTLETVTFYYTRGGLFRVDNATITNGSSIEYWNGTIIELAALPSNNSYRFLNYTWDTGSNSSNPYNLTVDTDKTVWLHYEIIVTGVAEPKLFIGVMLLGLGFALPIILVWNKKKKS